MSRIKESFFFIFVLCCSLGQGADGAYAQMKQVGTRADKYFNNYEYSKAIPLYEKASVKNDDALKKLADCYRLIKNYGEAEKAYSKLASKNPSDPLVYYYYGEALLSNNKYEEAKKQFEQYATQSPNDRKGRLYAKVCDDMKDLLIKPAIYKVYNLGEINSKGSDFCPVFYKDKNREGFVFASERIRDMVNNAENKRAPYLSLVFAKANKKKDTTLYEKWELFSQKLSGNGHYGPACFNSNFSEMFFTKVDNTVTGKRGAVSQPKLYWSKHGSGWKTPVALPFVSNDYATGHPTISKDGQYLYFSSNMPGGKGGTDIWVSKREGDTWGIPQNLGDEINTADDETFPYISQNNILYFSSNGHAGFGGLDIFASAQKDGKWSSVNNMMLPINSTSDDFGIIFNDDNSGCFSSNRTGGKGSDDLYGFALSGMITSISGKILLSNK
ncbi:MAG: tetratricopeptide repeat protein, partial [Bacteroidota bacterium]